MENIEVLLKLDVNKINVLLTGLGELPSKISYDLIQNIHKQVNDQINVQTPPKTE